MAIVVSFVIEWFLFYEEFENEDDGDLHIFAVFVTF